MCIYDFVGCCVLEVSYLLARTIIVFNGIRVQGRFSYGKDADGVVDHWLVIVVVLITTHHCGVIHFILAYFKNRVIVALVLAVIVLGKRKGVPIARRELRT